MQQKTLSKPRTISRSSLPKQSVVKSAVKHPLTGLQQSIGNRAVQRLIQSHYIQAKLNVSSPEDPLEQEADQVANTVMRAPPVPSANVSNQIQAARIYRKCSNCEKAMQRQTVDEEEESPAGTLQKKTSSVVMPQGHAVESVVGNSRGGTLPNSVRRFFEPRFGHDFGGVRLHTGTQAAESARALNARAYTTGNDVVFGAGQYSPDTNEGRKLLAHELTHVVQQSNNLRPSSMLGVQRKCEGCTDEEDKAKQPMSHVYRKASSIEFENTVSDALPSRGDMKSKCPTAAAAPSSFSLGPRSAADIATWNACKWGGTRPDPLKVDTDCCEDGGNWQLIVKKVRSKVTTHSRHLSGQNEATVPSSTSGNFCDQVTDLDALGRCAGSWYMLSAVKAHEAIHYDEWKSSFPTDWPALETNIEGLTVPASGATKTKAKAEAQMRSNATFTKALDTSAGGGNFPTFWAIADPNANTNAAERAVVDPRIEAICKHAKKKAWSPGACAVCSAKGII
jgi:hypothetical protein